MSILSSFFRRRNFPCREALVTGASRGLGREFALALLGAGVRVWGTSRTGNGLPDGVRPLALDLADAAGVNAFAARLLAEAPALDLLVNNAGAGVWCPFSRFPADALEAQWRVLLASPAALCREFYGCFAAAGRGTIVNVSSLAGAFPMPFLSAYSAAKAGLAALTETLMLESEGAGQGVVVIDFQPGDFCTGFNDAMEEPFGHGATTGGGDAVAGGVLARSRAACERNFRAGPPPSRAVDAFMRAVRRQRCARIVTGGFAQTRLGPFAARFLPRALVRFFLRKYYALR